MAEVKGRFANHPCLALACIAAAAISLHGQQTAPPQPTNNLPNPYQTVANHFQMPEGRTWGATSAVEVDKDGKSIWVGERCGVNTCLGSTLNPVLEFDESGKLRTSFGAGMMIFPHGIHVDKDGNIWMTDGQDNRPRRARGVPPDSPLPPAPDTLIGHQVFKFSPQGTLLLTLGTPGGGRDADYFYQPNDVLVAPNGNIFVSEGHSSAAGSNARILVFDKGGQFIKSFGKLGKGPGEFDQPHALAMDSKGRLFVGDRSNNRIQIFDQDGKYIAEWSQFSRPSGIAIDGQDNIYVADSESGGVDRTRTNWTRGIRIGSAKDGVVKHLVPDPFAICAQGQPSTPEAPCMSNTSAAEGVAIDQAGNVYGAEVGPRALKKYVKK